MEILVNIIRSQIKSIIKPTFNFSISKKKNILQFLKYRNVL